MGECGHKSPPPQTLPISVRPSQCKFSPRLQPVLQSTSAPSSCRSSQVASSKSMAESMSEELAFALALNESIRTANAEGIPVSSDAEFCPSILYQEHTFPDNTCNARVHQKPNKQFQRTRTNAYKATNSASQRWTSTRFLSKSLKEVFDGELPAAPPSAPPLPHMATYHASSDPHTKSVGTCVVCWDAPAEGACIPCGHLAGCMNCLAKVKSKGWGCPVCRGLIEQVIKVYAV